MEPKIAGKIASGMLRTCASIKPEKVLPVFLPHVCNVLTRVMADIDVTSDLYPGDELMFNMLLLSDLMLVPGELSFLKRTIELVL